eukprot:CAMPEP_0197492440 /NCGR_PEP_ID=MMETSP1311-20131121/8961_1 /TAXON_ID=464262 /ORGANISM="Genus nov. species nov., Strain RCC856" /LENGTH=153 /DNA_ID=CAMNT_0043037341 /DNA_START=88 /DNA_END=549 /DNA_ORIENTATION=+
MKAASLSACGTLLLLSTLSSPVAAQPSWAPWINVGAFGRINVGALDRILDRIPVMATTEDAAIVQDNGLLPIIEPELSLGETGEDIDVPVGRRAPRRLGPIVIIDFGSDLDRIEFGDPNDRGFAIDPDADFSLINLSGTSARSLPPPFPPNAG